MVGLQWCSACDAPRFKWSVRSVDDIPDVCWHCGEVAVEIVLVADGLSELRRQLGDWARGAGRSRGDQGWLNRRRAHVRERFDQVIGWWERQPTRPPELQRLLREYHRGGRLQTEPLEHASDQSTAERLAPARLHELTEQMKSLAEEERLVRESSKPKPTQAPGAWRMFPRPSGDGSN